jgi:NAD(P)H-hydrate epimerase
VSKGINSRNAVLTVKELGDADRMAQSAGTSEADLMQQAGQAVAEAIKRRWTVREVVVLCGPGNNGGDGFVAARCLADAGWTVRVALLGQRDSLTGAAAVHAQRWTGSLEPLTPATLTDAMLVVDAIYGAGLSRKVEGVAEETLIAVARAGIPLVAIDVPSGVLGDTGESLGAIAAALTVTFVRKKPGHVLEPGRSLCGDVVVADIGISDAVLARIQPTMYENDPGCWVDAIPLLQSAGNKYQRGHALISGGYPQTGASRLAARAAARVGAGLITIAVPDHALPIYATALISIMVHPLLAHEDFNHLLDDPRFSAVLIGPGSGVSEQTRARVLAMLGSGRPIVLDADALTSFAGNPAELEWEITGPCIITPHEGEFRRLFAATGDKVTRARAAARVSGAIVVLKGRDTVIASPDGRAIINSNAPPTLATAGSGDVLSGLILGLLAQGMEPYLAAAAGVWMHGAAATAFGSGLMAEDLPDLVPGVSDRLSRPVAAK